MKNLFFGFRNALLLVLLALPLILPARWDTNRPEPGRGKKKTPRTATACLPATSSAELSINNVRALLHNGGDMWWDLVGNPRYEVPKGSNLHSMFASSLWIGGFDGSGQLRIAAQTYRQSGNDFWPGPLRTDGTSTTERSICEVWDRHFVVTQEQIDAFLADYAANGSNISLANHPAIRDWPHKYTNNPAEFQQELAPIVDLNGNGEYEPSLGEYPRILGDQAIWWVINDRGDIHTETNGEQIGVEIQMLAFSFSRSDDVNNMTFYQEKVFNRGTNTLNNCYIAQWADPDLGFFADDYVGCDTIRGLGFCYNGDNFDDPPTGYGANPPAIGIDFFQGPFADPNDGRDNNNNGVIDEPDERINMSAFIYYNNDFSVRGNPVTAQDFYGYLSGFWKNGAPIVDDREYNGNGFPDPGEVNANPTNYMFPDFPGLGCGLGSCANISYSPTGTPWSEVCVGLDPFDRRFVQSAGPFTLLPGAFNEIVIGVVWARDLSAPDQLGSVCKLLAVDDIAQVLFDNDFQTLRGPDAPNLFIEEFDQELAISWSYTNPQSNNRFNNYVESDPVLEAAGNVNPIYRFEGFILYQLRDAGVSSADLENPTLARPIFQCDVRNGVRTIINREVSSIDGFPLIVDQVKVEGADRGIVHSFRVTEDIFAEGSNKRIVNYRTYYFSIVAYAHNGDSAVNQRFIVGNRNVQRYDAMPHKTEFQNLGMTLNSAFGDGPVVTQTRGIGNGGRFTRLEQGLREQIVRNGFAERRFAPGAAPINIRVVNPKQVKDKKYRVVVTRDLLREVQLIEDESGAVTDSVFLFADWALFEIDRNTGAQVGDTIFHSKYSVRVNVSTGRRDTFPRPLDGTEHFINGHGLAISVLDAPDPGTDSTALFERNGVIGASIDYENPQNAWLSGLPDIDNFDLYNWIRSGPTCDDGPSGCGQQACDNGACAVDPDRQNFSHRNTYQASQNFDPNKAFETLLSGTFAPYILSAHFHTIKDIIGPRLRVNQNAAAFQENNEIRVETPVQLRDLNNVDIVITPNPELWSRCIVIETSPTKGLGSGAHPMAPRWAISKEPDGCEMRNVTNTPLDPNGNLATQQYGYSYFPGYAVDLDRGIRLNIFFGESSWHREQNGGDMLFNPTNSTGSDGRAVGGRHYLYVTNQAYDGCESFRQFRVGANNVNGGSPTGYRYTVNGQEIRMDSIFKHVAWTAIPLTSDQRFNFTSYCNIPTEARVSLRVNKAFRRDAVTNELPTFEFQMSDYAAQMAQADVAKASVKNQINIVPNPFYGRSGIGRGSYEANQLDNRVKITNLPRECTIRIFTLNGQVVRIFRKENEAPDQEWDLRNDAGVPIASGMYILHIDAKDFGEKILKFMCIMPQTDLNAY